MPSIRKMKIRNIYYQLVNDEQRTGFAASKSIRGVRLKKQFEEALKMIDYKKYFNDYFKYMNLPDQGIVEVD